MTLPARPVRVVQVVPVDGIGGVEVAARSALVPTSAMDFALAPMAGGAVAGTTGTVLAGRHASPDDPRAVVDTVRRVLAFNPDVVIGSLWRSASVLLALRIARPRLKLVYFLHSAVHFHAADRLMGGVGVRVADAVWCDSHATLEARLSPAQRQRARVVSLVTERLAAPDPPPAAPHFAIWARLTQSKGVDRAVELVARLAARGIDAHYSVGGPDGGARTGLEAEVRAQGLDDRVAFLGPVAPEDRLRIAAGSTFFLQLSRIEGMGMSVVEAMQLGLIPVVTPAGEVARYVEDGINGVVVDATNLDAAAERIAALLAAPARLAAMRAAAIATWTRAPLYRDDVATAAQALLTR